MRFCKHGWMAAHMYDIQCDVLGGLRSWMFCPGPGNVRATGNASGNTADDQE